MLEKKVFTGGMNKDTEDRLVPQGDWRDALNVRAGITEGSNLGSIENVKGNTNRSAISLSGIGEAVIGSVEDKTLNRVFYFITKGVGTKDRVVQYDYASNTETVLISNNIFNFDASYPITSAEIIDQRYLVWTDNINEPCFIDITKALSGGYNVGLTRQDVDLYAWQPVFPVTYSYSDDSSQKFNNLKGSLWQFTYRWVYEDGRKSFWSTYSRINTPNELNYNSIDPTKNNVINLTINTGNQNVSKIEVASRKSNLDDFYLIRTLDKSDLSYSDNTFETIEFRNNNVKLVIPSNEFENFSSAPIKAKALSFMGGNRLAISNVVEGYDNINLDVSADYIINENIDILGNTVVGSPTASVFYGIETISGRQYHGIRFVGPFSGNEIFTFQYIGLDNSGTNVNITFSVDSTNLSSYWGTTDAEKMSFKFRQEASAYNIALSPGSFILPPLGNEISLREKTVSTFESWTVSVSGNTSNNLVFNPNSYKRGAYHNLAIAYYDEKGRHGTAQISDDLTIYVPFFDNQIYGTVSMEVTINNYAPDWAKYYQILYGRNSTILHDPEGRSFIQFINDSPVTVDVSRGSKVISLGAINEFNNIYGTSIVNYEFVEGDRLRVVAKSDKSLFPQVVETEILYFNPVNNTIEIDQSISIPTATGTLFEIYRPNKNVNAEDLLYYEMGDVFDIVERNGKKTHNGNNQNQDGLGTPAITVIQNGDVYVKRRDHAYSGGNIPFSVEDSHLSDFYPSNFISTGKPNVVDADYKQLRKPTKIYYSDVYIPDTNINGLSSFYALNFEEYDRAYGSIQHLYSEDKRLLCFQELKVGQILVNEQILSDQSGSNLVQKSDKVLSDIVYYAGEFGIGTNPESFAVYGFSKYFVDIARGAVLRLSNDGITKISDYGMRTYFSGLFNSIIGYSDKIIGTYDERYGEYVLNIQSDFKEVNLTLAFNDETNRWTSFYSFLPEWMETYGNSMCSFKGGKIYSHGDGSYNTFYGTKYNSSITVLANQNPSNTKVYQAVMVESNDLWNCPSITNQVGQSTNLIDGDFEEIEKVYWANLLRDVNSRGGLVNGDDMRSPELTVKFENDSTNFVKLFSVGIRSVDSERTNK